MTKYELIFILKADQPEAEMAARVERVRSIVSAHDGEITQENPWGVRRLAYEIEHENKGNYMFLKFRASGAACARSPTTMTAWVALCARAEDGIAPTARAAASAPYAPRRGVRDLISDPAPAGIPTRRPSGEA